MIHVCFVSLSVTSVIYIHKLLILCNLYINCRLSLSTDAVETIKEAIEDHVDDHHHDHDDDDGHTHEHDELVKRSVENIGEAVDKAAGTHISLHEPRHVISNNVVF